MLPALPPRRRSRQPRAVLAIACALAVAAIAGAGARSSPQLRPGWSRTLAPGTVLVAARNLPDPNFSQTVVLLVDYGSEGAMGLIVNRRTAVPLSRVFPKLKRAGSPVYFGGPVEVTGALALVRSDDPPADSRRVIDGVHLLSTRQPLERMATVAADPDRFRVYLGYSGWGPGQLETEMAHRSWHVQSADAELVFDPDPETVWQREITRSDAWMVWRAPLPTRGAS